MTKKTSPVQFEPGLTYYGPHNERLMVMSVEGDQVTVRYPVSLRIETRPMREMQKFAAASDRRSYRPNRGKMRTKIEETDSHVVYLDHIHRRHKVTRKAWTAWRAKA
jgi:hypothetical protein